MATRRKRRGGKKSKSGRPRTRTYKSKRGTWKLSLVSGGGRKRAKRSRKKSRRRATSKSGRVYARTKSGRFKHVASRIGSRAHRKGRRRARKGGRRGRR